MHISKNLGRGGIQAIGGISPRIKPEISREINIAEDREPGDEAKIFHCMCSVLQEVCGDISSPHTDV